MTGLKVQSDTQLNATIGKVGSNGSYFSAAVGDFGNVDQLLADTRVNSYLRNAYGVSSTTSDADLKAI